MSYLTGGKVVGRDNISVGNATGPENIAVGVVAPLRNLEASAVGTVLTVSSITRSSQTATATTSVSHGCVVGDVVRIKGAAQNEYNGDRRLLTVPSGTTFTFNVNGSPASGSGTMTAQHRIRSGNGD